MRYDLIIKMKEEIRDKLTDYLRNEGIELKIADNDNVPLASPSVIYEGCDDSEIERSILRWEIRVILGILGKSWQCDKLADQIYHALKTHQPTTKELTTLLMSMHVDKGEYYKYGYVRKRTYIRYFVGEC